MNSRSSPIMDLNKLPALKGTDKRLLLILFGFAILAQLPGLLWGVPSGKAMNNALRILAGDVIYRDFWTMYAPGHSYLAALLLKLFTAHVWVLGIASAVLVAFDASVLFVIMRRLQVGARTAALVAGVFVVSQWHTAATLTSYETALAPLLLAVERAVVYANGGRAHALFTSGLLCGIGAWFKHDVAFYVAVGIILGLTLASFLDRARQPESWISPIGVLYRVGGGAMLVLLPIITLLLTAGAGKDAWRDAIVFPVTDFRIVRSEGYPPQIPWRQTMSWVQHPFDPLATSRFIEQAAKSLQGSLPELAFAIGLVIVVVFRHRVPPAALSPACIALSAMPLFWTAAHVQQNTHLTTLWMLSMVTIGALFGGIRFGTARRYLIALGFLMYSTALTVEPGLRMVKAIYSRNTRTALEFPSVAGIKAQRDDYEVYRPIVSYIRKNVPAGEAIYVGLKRHDAVVISKETFYYLAGRPMASRYNELHPGIVDRVEVQREIIEDLNRLNVRCVVLWDFGWSKSVMDGILARRKRQLPDAGSTLLDEFLRREFAVVARYGEFEIAWRKKAGPPPPIDVELATGRSIQPSS